MSDFDEARRSWFDAARIRGRRRKSAWNLLLIPAVVAPWSITWWLTARGLGNVCKLFHPLQEFTLLPDTVGGILIAIGSLFAWIGPSMIIANFLVSMVPPARKTLDAEAALVPGTDRRSANRDLLRLSWFLTPASLLLGLVGAWMRP